MVQLSELGLGGTRVTFSGLEDKSPKGGGTTDRGRLVSRHENGGFPILGSPTKRYISRS